MRRWGTPVLVGLALVGVPFAVFALARSQPRPASPAALRPAAMLALARREAVRRGVDPATCTVEGPSSVSCGGQTGPLLSLAFVVGSDSRHPPAAP